MVERSNIIIDGNWHTLEGDNLPIPGLNLTSVSNVTINNANIKRFDTGIYLESASQCIISGNNLTLSNAGIRLYSSSLNNISQNIITNNTFGIRLEEQSHSNTISRNEVADYGNGIDLYSLDFFQENNIIFGNDIKNNGWGIHFLVTSNCTITRNSIENNTEGVVIYRSRYTTITENNITSNTNHGIYLDMSYDGKVYHNNFVGNGSPYLYSSTNMWDDGYPSGGNYWSDYEERYPNATEIDGSGIWDTPYEIDENNQDNYPLVHIVPEFPSFLILPLFMITSLLAVIIYKRKHSLLC
ncbi:MAG: right-handed parallel beta-helix repeat-containing protein [Candidatus Bathyarchaeota archaeon]|nr:right-handed parallel beta-helix repeat-containing protein [Candidatus Bathyarchaeota archaeon]